MIDVSRDELTSLHVTRVVVMKLAALAASVIMSPDNVLVKLVHCHFHIQFTITFTQACNRFLNREFR